MAAPEITPSIFLEVYPAQFLSFGTKSLNYNYEFFEIFTIVACLEQTSCNIIGPGLIAFIGNRHAFQSQTQFAWATRVQCDSLYNLQRQSVRIPAGERGVTSPESRVNSTQLMIFNCIVCAIWSCALHFSPRCCYLTLNNDFNALLRYLRRKVTSPTLSSTACPSVCNDTDGERVELSIIIYSRGQNAQNFLT